MVKNKSWNQEDDGKLSASRNKPTRLRKRLMLFIGEYANWDVRNDVHWTNCAREMITGCHGGNPILLDPFAGGGSIPLEGIRIGAETYATDLNPIPVLLNRLQIEYLPRMSDATLKKAEEEAARINDVLKEELSRFYPTPKELEKKEVPIGYLCARTVQCEGVGCGIVFPLLSSPWVVKSKKNKICYTFSSSSTGKVVVGLKEDPTEEEVPNKTVHKGHATCPICNHTTPVASVRRQLRNRSGGTDDSWVLVVVSTPINGNGRLYRVPFEEELLAREKSIEYVKNIQGENNSLNRLIPDEKMVGNSRYLTPPFYGTETWADIYTSRQLLTQLILTREVIKISDGEVKLILALSASKFTDRNTSLCIWSPSTEWFLRCFGIQTVQMTWDFFEPRPFGNGGSNWTTTFINVLRGIKAAKVPDGIPKSHASFADAQNHPMLDKSVDIWATDPPYYDSIPYSDISNYFVIWLKRMLPNLPLECGLAPKDGEVVMDGSKTSSGEIKNSGWYESHVELALKEGNRVTKDEGISYWVYAHKSTEGWATVLKAIVAAGWMVTGSWPISTERATRLRAQRSAALETSVHIVMRPRPENAGIGGWSDILGELPIRINGWLQRLNNEGITGADAIFACIGPAMELYSKWETVEKADGTEVHIDDYLKNVWDTVANEAMKIIDPTSKSSIAESDARFSMMVLWTLRQSQETETDNREGESVEAEKNNEKESKPSSSDLPFDTASLLARGIGADINELEGKNLVEMKKKQNKKFVSLLSPAERRYYLLGVDNGKPTLQTSTTDKNIQLKLGEDVDQARVRKREEEAKALVVDIPKRDSALDHLHQAMLLHADGNTAALDRLIKDVIGDDQTTWQLAFTLNTLYPEGSWERSKIEGVIAHYDSLFRKR
jgi:adenine-specific DNA methylase